MSKLQWDKTGERYYETGVDRVVLYVSKNAEAWSGVTAINESPSGAEPTKIYADNVVYGVVMSPEEDALTIEAFQYPALFNKCIGKDQLANGVYIGQQPRVPFGLSWRSKIGNDLSPDAGYKIHIAFTLYSSSSEDSNSTINDSPEQKTFSFSATAMPNKVDDEHSTCVMVLDSREFNKRGIWNALQAIENMLYGTATADPKIPTVANIMSAMENAETLMDSDGNSILDSDDGVIKTSVYMTA